MLSSASAMKRSPFRTIRITLTPVASGIHAHGTLVVGVSRQGTDDQLTGRSHSGRGVNGKTMRVSVIIPCYNTARYLTEALTSACRQTPSPWEVIVVDDGSTDDSAAIAEAFGAPVRCERRPHQGIGATRNHGLACVTGDIVAFLDADDVWTDDSI